MEQFHIRGIARTQDRCGVLIFVSLEDRYVRVVADDGIAARDQTRDERGDEEGHEGVQAGAQHQDDDGGDAQDQGQEELEIHGDAAPCGRWRTRGARAAVPGAGELTGGTVHVRLITDKTSDKGAGLL
jgi:hypothetical protein